MPFFAEEMYQRLKLKNMPESVHLFNWPKSDKKKIDKDLDEKMRRVREIVVLALAKRAEAGIKTRQPLAELKIQKNKFKKDLLDLIKDEVNVRKISFGKELKLNTKITKALQKEGEYRELVRNINKIRKEMGLTQKDKISIESTFKITNKEKLKKEVGAKKLSVEKQIDNGKEVEISGKQYYLSIMKVQPS